MVIGRFVYYYGLINEVYVYFDMLAGQAGTHQEKACFTYKRLHKRAGYVILEMLIRQDLCAYAVCTRKEH